MVVSLAEMAAQLRRRREEQDRLARARAERLRSRLPAARDLLLGHHGAAVVRLFGSLARGDVTPESDVDLAVAGMPSANYFRALADLMTLFGSPVDLVRIEEAPPSLRERIAAEGCPL